MKFNLPYDATSDAHDRSNTGEIVNTLCILGSLFALSDIYY